MDFDAVVIGGGPIGASLAAVLSAGGMHVALAEQATPSPSRPDWDTRVYALSPSSVAFLESAGIWDRLPEDRLTPIHTMEVFGDASRSRIGFSAYDAGVSMLACTVEAGRLAQAAWETVASSAGVALFCPATPARLEQSKDHVRVELAGGTEITARLCVGADGMHSWVRREAAFHVRSRALPECGVVANLEAELPHNNTAFQWFRPDGVLAWLPLGGRLISIVWSTPEPHARELLSLDPAEFCAAVARAGNDRLGALRVVTPQAAFPLARLSVPRRVQRRIALIGDAAHVVHPLAGQGMNLGFGDARALAQVLRDAAGRDPGDLLLLRRFERKRAEDILAMSWMTDGLHLLFSAAHPALWRLRNLGLGLVDAAPFLKTLLARRAIGRAA